MKDRFTQWSESFMVILYSLRADWVRREERKRRKERRRRRRRPAGRHES